MREGRVFRRCTKCGVGMKMPRCANCDSPSYTWGYMVDIAAAGAPRRQKKKGGYRTKNQALEAMNELQATTASGTFVEPKKMTVAQYLTREWLPVARGGVRAGTFDSYELHVRAYISPVIGDVPLQQLTRAQVKELYRGLAESGSVRGGGLSPKTVHNVHLTLRKALADAVEDRLLMRNPADAAHKLPSNRPQMKTWTAEQLRVFLHHVKDDELFALWRLAATTGLRRGEVIGLRWRDLDLDSAQLSVVQQRVKGSGSVSVGAPKTAKGRRTVALDTATVSALRAHRAAQIEIRLVMGPGWRNEGFVFSNVDGSALDPDGLSGRFERHVRDSGLPRIRLHDLRHTHATLALMAGVHPVVMQERLGHASISVTLDVYSHAIPAMQADAANKVAAVLDGVSVTPTNSVTNL